MADGDRRLFARVCGYGGCIASEDRILKNKALLITALFLAGCSTTATAPGPGPVRTVQGVWVRSDGQSGRDNPALAAQFESDRSACTFAGASEPDRSCMDQRGYLLVPADQAAAKAAELRAAKAAVQGGGTM